jgi:putative flavoprotein involved in K+ transport
LRHEGEVADVPGLYALGLNFMRRRKSSFIHGAEDDVRDIATHLLAYPQQRKSVRRRTRCDGTIRRILWLAHNR